MPVPNGFDVPSLAGFDSHISNDASLDERHRNIQREIEDDDIVDSARDWDEDYESNSVSSTQRQDQRSTSDGLTPRSLNRVPTEKKQKLDALNKLVQLAKRSEFVEKEIFTQIGTRRQEFDPTDYATFEDYVRRLDQERAAEQRDLLKQLRKLNNDVKGFSRLVSSSDVQHIALDKLQNTMEGIERGIVQVKEQSRDKYEDLIREERLLTAEINAWEKTIESWKDRKTTDVIPVARRSQTPRTVSSLALTQAENIPKEVIAYETFVRESGGIYGDWDEADHQIFLQHRLKGKRSFLSDVALALHRPIAEVSSHEHWYRRFLEHTESKRVAIAEWRNEKEWRRHKEQLVHEEGGLLGEREKEERRRMKEARMEEERKERERQLAIWKERKEEERRQQEEEKKRAEAERRAKLEKEREEKARIKEQVRGYVAQKELEKRLESITLECDNLKRPPSAAQLASLHERDKRLVQERQAKLKAKEAEAAEREARLRKLAGQVEPQVKRDRTRLLQETAALKHRKEDKSPRGAVGITGNWLPHRAVPTWRQGV
eukprot:Colp12_sorted_trinity150504_noHs@14803